MELSSSSKFRFRDHKEMGDSMDGGTSSESSSVSSDGDDGLAVESMTGKVSIPFLKFSLVRVWFPRKTNERE